MPIKKPSKSVKKVKAKNPGSLGKVRPVKAKTAAPRGGSTKAKVVKKFGPQSNRNKPAGTKGVVSKPASKTNVAGKPKAKAAVTKPYKRKSNTAKSKTTVQSTIKNAINQGSRLAAGFDPKKSPVKKAKSSTSSRKGKKQSTNMKKGPTGRKAR